MCNQRLSRTNIVNIAKTYTRHEYFYPIPSQFTLFYYNTSERESKQNFKVTPHVPNPRTNTRVKLFAKGKCTQKLGDGNSPNLIWKGEFAETLIFILKNREYSRVGCIPYFIRRFNIFSYIIFSLWRRIILLHRKSVNGTWNFIYLGYLDQMNRFISLLEWKYYINLENIYNYSEILVL